MAVDSVVGILPSLCLSLPNPAPPAEMPAWVVPLVSLLAALFVAGANYAVQRWRYRIDRVGVAIDHICTEINLAADVSTRYWLLDTTQNDQAKTSEELEPELVGRQMRLQSLMVALKELDHRLRLESAEAQLVSLFDTLTGDDFQVTGRGRKPERARLAQSFAAQLNGELRTAAGKRSQRYV
jgi:hypothetical protein